MVFLLKLIFQTVNFACFNNIGPGLELVGPTCNFSIYGPLAKIVLIFDMLAGRFGNFPNFDSLSRDTWRADKY